MTTLEQVLAVAKLHPEAETALKKLFPSYFIELRVGDIVVIDKKHYTVAYIDYCKIGLINTGGHDFFYGRAVTISDNEITKYVKNRFPLTPERLQTLMGNQQYQIVSVTK